MREKYELAVIFIAKILKFKYMENDGIFSC